MKKELKLLKVIINNHPLIKDNTEFSLLANQRVFKEKSETLTNLFCGVWLNNLAVIAGMNATGKTTIMKSVIGILNLLLKNLSINQTRLNEVLIGEEPINFKIFLYGMDSKVYLDDITLSPDNDSVNGWLVSDEIISVNKIQKSRSTKKQLFDLNNFEQLYKRSELDKDIFSILAKDDSMFRMVISKGEYMPQLVFDTLTFTNTNVLLYTEKEVPSELLNYLDPTIEYLKFDVTDTGNVIYRLKFKNRDKEITDNNFAIIELFLSSGTAKAITLYQHLLKGLMTGGIVFVDEIENHFNHAILRTLINFFTDKEININRACLVYSTHYTEILDDVQRGDQLYITRRDDKIEFIRYSDKGIREDFSKSEIFASDYLHGTAPGYESYMALKNSVKELIKNEQ